MSFYSAFILISIAAIVSRYLDPKSRRIISLISFGLILYISCFAGVDAKKDAPDYMKYFNRIRDLRWDGLLKNRIDVTYFEPGFVILDKVLSLFVSTAEEYLFLMGIICCLPVLIFIYYKSDIPMMSLVIYYSLLFADTISAFRQIIACQILLLSYKYIVEKDFKRFLVIVLIATSFHRSAIVFLLMYLLYWNIRITEKTILFSSVGSVVCFLLRRPIRLVVNMYATRPPVAGYNGGAAMLCFMWVAFLLVFIIMGKEKLNSKQYKLFFMMMMFMAITQPLAFEFKAWFRVQMYFLIAFVLMLPAALNKLYDNPNNRKLAFLIESLFCAGCFVLVRSFYRTIELSFDYTVMSSLLVYIVGLIGIIAFMVCYRKKSGTIEVYKEEIMK